MRKILVICLVLFTAVSARAVEGNEVLYVSGTASSLSPGALGHFDLTADGALAFSANGQVLSIPYKSITSYEYTHEVARHLGVVAAVAVAMVKKRQQRHFFRVTFADSDHKAQVAVFEVPKHLPPTLIEVLKARAPQACTPRDYGCSVNR